MRLLDHQPHSHRLTRTARPLPRTTWPPNHPYSLSMRQNPKYRARQCSHHPTAIILDDVHPRLRTHQTTPMAPHPQPKMALPGATISERFLLAHPPPQHQHTHPAAPRPTQRPVKRSPHHLHLRRRLPRSKLNTSQPCTTSTVTQRAICPSEKVTASAWSRRRTARRTGGKVSSTANRAAFLRITASESEDAARKKAGERVWMRANLYLRVVTDTKTALDWVFGVKIYPLHSSLNDPHCYCALPHGFNFGIDPTPSR